MATITATTTTGPVQIGTTSQAAAIVQHAQQPESSSSSSILHASLARIPPKIVKAQGNYLTTSTGHKIFDATGGAAVACIGHAHPRIKAAISKQLDSVAYCYSPFFTTQASENLAAHLTASTNGQMSKVFIVSSGTEAVEAALKLARQHFVEREGKGTERCHFIGRKQGYHGNTLGSLAVGGHVARKAIYEPLLAEKNVSHVSACYAYRGMRDGETEEGYVARLKEELEGEFERVGGHRVAGVVLETMSGLTLGAVAPVKGYLKAVKEVCDRYGALLILDEVMSGMGRTGTLHAWEQEDVVPHLQTVAKGLGAGYEPIGALLVNKSVVEALSKGTNSFAHSQTYQGHPVACAAACEVQQVVKDEKLLSNVQSLGPYLGSELKRRLGEHKHVGDVRGRGFMWALEFVEDKASKKPFPVEKKVAASMHAAGLSEDFGISLLPGGGVADGTNGDVIMLAPAYNVTKGEIDLIVEQTARVVEHVLGPR